MPLYLMLDAFNPILAKEVLEAQDLLAALPPLLMFSLLFLFSCSRCSSLRQPTCDRRHYASCVTDAGVLFSTPQARSRQLYLIPW